MPGSAWGIISLDTEAHMRQPIACVTAVLAALAAGGAAGAERPWLEVETPHFKVAGNAGEGELRDLAWQFEQVRAVFRALWPWARGGQERPFVVLAVRDEKALRDLAPAYWDRHGSARYAALYVSARDADYVALRTDVDMRDSVRVNPYKLAFEGYADNVLVRHFRTRIPLWYREGLAELFGNVLVRDKDVEIGRVIPWHLAELSGFSTRSLDARRELRPGAPATIDLLPLPRLMAVTRDDPEIGSQAARWRFTAQSWAFVHFLMFGEGGAHRPRFNRLIDLLRAGVPQDEAVPQALGDVSALERAYRNYVSARSYQFLRVDADVEVKKDRWVARPLAAPAADALRGRFRAAIESPQPSSVPVERRGADAPPNAAGSPALSAEELIALCNEGEEEACRRLVSGLRKACDGGDAAMCSPLAWLYANGRGVDLDVFTAEELYGRACDGGVARACASLARSILARSVEAADKERAAALLAKACAGGLTAACTPAKR